MYNCIQGVIEMLLDKYYNTAYHSYSAQSFYPEKRANQVIEEFSTELAMDLAQLDSLGNYQEKYEAKFLAWLSAKGRCMSAMITGPANFPVAKNRKNMQSEQNKWEEFRSWRERYFKAVNRQRTLSPEEEIDATLAKLDKLIVAHETMKGINKIVKSNKADDEKIAEIVEKYGLKEDEAKKILTPDCMGFVGFAPYSLTNSNARIKNAQEKLEIMKSRIARKETWEPIIFAGGKIDIESDRVIVKHDEKPAADIIMKLKARGFRWSRNYSCWLRKHTARAIIDAKEICGVT